MPSKKTKFNARFPPARIKKIMQTDDEIGKVAAPVPVLISKALELFVESLLTKSSQQTQEKHARTLTTSHIKQCIHKEKKFDFLKDLVENIPDLDKDAGNTTTTESRKRERHRKGKGRKRKHTTNTEDDDESSDDDESESQFSREDSFNSQENSLSQESSSMQYQYGSTSSTESPSQLVSFSQNPEPRYYTPTLPLPPQSTAMSNMDVAGAMGVSRPSQQDEGDDDEDYDA